MSLALACALTVLIETPFLMCFGYRDRRAVTVIVCVNIITNLTMNAILLTLFPHRPAAALAIAEALVVAAEYALYAAAFGRSLKLLALTAAANALTCALGLLIAAL